MPYACSMCLNRFAQMGHVAPHERTTPVRSPTLVLRARCWIFMRGSPTRPGPASGMATGNGGGHVHVDVYNPQTLLVQGVV